MRAVPRAEMGREGKFNWRKLSQIRKRHPHSAVLGRA
jgi:hypothetical protein